MKMTKKVLSLLLALSMIVGVFSVMASAAKPDSAVDLFISCDKASYAPGDEVVLTISEQAISEVGKMFIGGQYAIAYDSSALEMYTTLSTDPAEHGFTAIAPGYDASISDIKDSIANGDTVDAAGAASYGWDSVMLCIVGDDSTEVDCSSKTDLFSIKMKIPTTAADGDYVIGFNKQSYVDYIAFSNDAAMGGVYGYDDDYGYGTTANYSFGTCTIHVGSAAPASILNPFKSQIRFDKSTDGTYAGTFDVRQLAVVSKANFESTFGATTAEQLTKIAEVGFVFARTSTVATFDVDTAKALIENGTAAAGYTKKTVDYITTNAVVGTDNYGFSCIVEDIPTADNADGMNALAYIKGTDGTYHYYPAAQSTSFNDLYTTHYSSAFPG